MVLDPNLTFAYLIVATALALSPGPDVMFVLANGLENQRRGALASSFGIAAGSLIHAIAAGLGVSAIIGSSQTAFELLRYAGAAYLLWLGIQTLKKWWSAPTLAKLEKQDEKSTLAIFRSGLITNLLNPKVIIFYLALLPQFVNLALGSPGVQIFLLGAIHAAIGLIYLVCIGLIAGHAKHHLTDTHIGRWLDAVAGIFFVGLALRLLLFEKTEAV